MIIYRVTAFDTAGHWAVRYFPQAHVARAFGKTYAKDHPGPSEPKVHKLTLKPFSREAMCALMECGDAHPMSMGELEGVVNVEEL